MCDKHIDKKYTLSNMVLSILNSLISDALLLSFTYKGDSILETKTNKLTSFENVCNFFKDTFVYAGGPAVNKCSIPLDKDVEKALSAAVRHALERETRKEKKNKEQQSTK